MRNFKLEIESVLESQIFEQLNKNKQNAARLNKLANLKVF
jgi:hypothetical protein